MNPFPYAGNKTPTETMAILQEDPNSVLVDVRTTAEWAFVGFPDLSGIGKQMAFVAWLEFPEMAVNEDFVEQVRAHAPNPDAPVLFLCRSGQRSQSAAAALTAAGYTACFNVLEGFEGDKNETGHRGTSGGWKVAGLPWAQR